MKIKFTKTNRGFGKFINYHSDVGDIYLKSVWMEDEFDVIPDSLIVEVKKNGQEKLEFENE